MVTIRPLSLSLSRPLSRELVWLTDADQLALDLQFATDKTLTARKGPTPVLTRASTGTFIGSNGLIQSAANHAARFDHDPITLACNGLLIEESRANLQRNSAAFNLWTTTSTTVTADQTTAPDGTSTADTITETATTATHFIADVNAPVTSGNTYTLSVFAKKGAGATAPNLIQIAASAATIGNTKYATFNIQNGSVNSFSGGTASINAYPNGWYRLVFTVTAVTTGNTAMIVGFVGALPAQRLPSYLGAITSDVYLWGAQIEAGPSASSYIPTTTASVVRSADVCSIAGADFTSFWNRFAGTCVVGVGSSGASVTSSPNTFIGTSPLTRTFAIFGSTAISFAVPPPIFSGTIVASGATYPIKLGLAYAINDYQTTYNGNLGGSVTDTNGTIPDSTDLRIGCDSFITFGTKHIQFVRYYKKRLPNAKLQSLTI